MFRNGREEKNILEMLAHLIDPMGYLTSQDTSIPNGRSSSNLNVSNDGGTWRNKYILINNRSLIKYVHQSSMPRH